MNDVKGKLGLPEAEVTRIETLLGRAGQFGMALAAWNEKGIFALTVCDEDYPKALRTKLRELAPPVLYYAGSLSLLGNQGVAVVGSRDIEEDAFTFTGQLARRCVKDGLNIVSGGARGIDSIAENAANSAGGSTVIVVADSLENKIRQKETREAVMKKQALILSAFRPNMHFQAYAAMERNKYIYALADYAVVVSSSYNQGGTWAGATENIKHKWTPMFVRQAQNMPEGNSQLLSKEGVLPIPAGLPGDESISMLKWLSEKAQEAGEAAGADAQEQKEEYRQQSLFDMLR
jgi:predicted Rossmann fold nucleotide-binding protein DprA/Smf involved in DNA uptake